MGSELEAWGCCFSRFAGYEAGACTQAERVVVTLKVLIGAVPTCMIITGLCILMVGPAPKVPSQDPSRRQSLQRWAPHAHGYTRWGTSSQVRTNVCQRETNRPTVVPETFTRSNTPAFADSSHRPITLR